MQLYSPLYLHTHTCTSVYTCASYSVHIQSMRIYIYTHTTLYYPIYTTLFTSILIHTRIIHTRILTHIPTHIPSVDHLALHTMIRHLDTPEWAELRKYQTLKDELGRYIYVYNTDLNLT